MPKIDKTKLLKKVSNHRGLHGTKWEGLGISHAELRQLLFLKRYQYENGKNEYFSDPKWGKRYRRALKSISSNPRALLSLARMEPKTLETLGINAVYKEIKSSITRATQLELERTKPRDIISSNTISESTTISTDSSSYSDKQLSEYIEQEFAKDPLLKITQNQVQMLQMMDYIITDPSYLSRIARSGDTHLINYIIEMASDIQKSSGYIQRLSKIDQLVQKDYGINNVIASLNANTLNQSLDEAINFHASVIQPDKIHLIENLTNHRKMHGTKFEGLGISQAELRQLFFLQRYKYGGGKSGNFADSKWKKIYKSGFKALASDSRLLLSLDKLDKSILEKLGISEIYEDIKKAINETTRLEMSKIDPRDINTSLSISQATEIALDEESYTDQKLSDYVNEEFGKINKDISQNQLHVLQMLDYILRDPSYIAKCAENGGQELINYITTVAGYIQDNPGFIKRLNNMNPETQIDYGVGQVVTSLNEKNLIEFLEKAIKLHVTVSTPDKSQDSEFARELKQKADEQRIKSKVPLKDLGGKYRRDKYSDFARELKQKADDKRIKSKVPLKDLGGKYRRDKYSEFGRDLKQKADTRNMRIAKEQYAFDNLARRVVDQHTIYNEQTKNSKFKANTKRKETMDHVSKILDKIKSMDILPNQKIQLMYGCIEANKDSVLIHQSEKDILAKLGLRKIMGKTESRLVSCYDKLLEEMNDAANELDINLDDAKQAYLTNPEFSEDIQNDFSKGQGLS